MKTVQEIKAHFVVALMDHASPASWALQAGNLAEAKQHLNALMEEVRILVDDIEAVQRVEESR